MFKWNKLGRVFNPTEIKNKSWMKEFAQSPSVLIFDKFIGISSIIKIDWRNIITHGTE